MSQRASSGGRDPRRSISVIQWRADFPMTEDRSLELSADEIARPRRRRDPPGHRVRRVAAPAAFGGHCRRRRPGAVARRAAARAGAPVRRAARPRFRSGDPEGLRHRRPRIPRVHPGRRHPPLRRGGLRRRRGQPVRRGLRGGSRPRADRSERRAMVLRHRRISGGGARVPDDGRLARDLLRAPHRAARTPPGGLPVRGALRVGPGAPLRREGRDARRVPGGKRPRRSFRRDVPHPARRARGIRSSGSRRRAHVPSSSSAARARRTPARWTTCRVSRLSASARVSGSTWTRPTAASSS